MLSNKYRPQSLDDVIGQSQIVQILKKEIENNNTKSAYLFIGNNGTGKTSVARILGKELNAYTIELDMASHGTANDMRDLVEQVKVKPLGFNKTLVILDEVQAAMSRKDSMAAQVLLKTLEEPPSYVIFILCTTEGDKVIETIKSRCETFIFSNISKEDILKRLQYICRKEKIAEKGLPIIAQRARGSLRQAITYLEQLQEIDPNKFFGIGTYDTYFDLIFAAIDKNVESLVKICKNVDEAFIQGFYAFILDCTIYLQTHNMSLVEIPEVYAEDIEELKLDTLDFLIKELTILQYRARNNPIIRHLFLSIFFRMGEFLCLSEN